MLKRIAYLPANPLILLMKTHDIRSYPWFSVGSDNDAIKVLDYAQAVTTERKIVSAVSSASVTEIEGLFAVERRSGVGVRHSHLADA
jgi:hypothetical protein